MKKASSRFRSYGYFVIFADAQRGPFSEAGQATGCWRSEFAEAKADARATSEETGRPTAVVKITALCEQHAPSFETEDI